MSADATEPTPAQPEGQGGDGYQAGLYDLNAAPPELRPYIEPELKKMEGNVTKKFQEAAEFRKQVEPLMPLLENEGISDIPAEDLSGLIEFYSMAQDPEQFENWWSSVGEELGFFADGDDEGEGEDGAQSEQEGPPEWAQSLMQRLERLEGGVTQSQAQQRIAEAEKKIETDLASLKEQHGDFDEDAVCSLAMAYDDQPDAIARGFADYQRITGAAQSSLVDSKENQGGGRPVEGGGADTAPDEIRTFDEAKAAAKARFAAGAR